MKFFAVSLLATLAAATPIAVPEIAISGDLEARQLGSSKTELESGRAGDCPRAILIFARGSTEAGNLGTLGAPLGDALEREYGASDFWVQGVGGPYTAALGDNILPRGSSAASIREAVRLFNLANTKCPSTPVVAGGYSQGAALMAAAISDLNTSVRNTVVGTVLFGYTKNLQNLGGIPSYPSDRVNVICAAGDLVCVGTLTITAAHLSYADEARSEAPRFLISKIGN